MAMRGKSFIWRCGKYYLLLGAVFALILLSLSFSVLPQDAPAAMRRHYAIFALAALIGYGLLGWLLWWPHVRRLRHMQEVVVGYAQGNFTRRLPAGDRTELGNLSSDLNWMAHQLQGQASAEANRQQQQEAVLSSMLEGVVAIDTEGCFISMNRAARHMLLATPDAAVERQLISSLIRNEEVLRFFRQAMAATEPAKTELMLNGGQLRHIQLAAVILTDANERRMGTVVVLNDVTQIKRLEEVRRDFVANVSHELKTPITSIKGFMETLLEGAMEDPDDARHFLEIIARQADRLDAIIEDLLSLSRIERESDRGELTLQTGRLQDVLNGALLSTMPHAESRRAEVTCSCPDELTALMNAPLLEQAVVNLIDNAIKYGGECGKVLIEAARVDKRVEIRVSDEGPGIAAEHHQRIFERFYRVDKSRSRKMGGTGLGLSIVKYIVQAHGGTVDVKSAPGKGSTFTIRLPLNAASTHQ
jgi:two-component system, OmpR family, phosphate regulon sensor histidine kinase PhoR